MQHETTTATGRATQSAPIRLLLVEDDPEDSRRLSRALELADNIRFEISHAAQVEDALQELRDGDYDVVLLDLSLPEGEGIDALARARLATSSVPFVVMTSRDDETEALRALRFGAQDYVVKGESNPQLLVRAIRYAVERHRLLMDLETSRRREHFLATHDGLTGLHNRVALLEAFKRSLAYATRHERQLGVVFLDLDRFKKINDSLGHSSGDEVLKRVAERIAGSVRKSDLIARLGGDEFVALIHDVTDEAVPARVVEKILETISRPFLLGGDQYSVTASAGVAIFPQDGLDADELIKLADIAMYKAKMDGRNRFHFYTDGMNQIVVERLQLENRLREAIDSKGFVLCYQPQVDVALGTVTGAEALVRWKQPGKGLVPPQQFIVLAEETGLIDQLGEWVLRQACKDAARWATEGYHDLSVSVNVSPIQLRLRSFPETVVQILRETELNPRSLTLEITESAVMEPRGLTLSTLCSLREIGVRISIDDFGTGYSSLAALRHLPADELKIDRTFVSGVLDDPADATITRSLVDMSRGLGLVAVAEGIETREQGDKLLRQGCHRMQGYLFGKPAPDSEFRAVLSGKNSAWEDELAEVRRLAEGAES